MDQIVESSEPAVDGSRALLENILRHLDDGVMIFGLQGERLWVNDAAARLCGFENADELMATREELVGERFQIYAIDGKPLDPATLPGRRALAGEEPIPLLVRFRAAGEETDHISRVRAVPIHDAAGALQYVISFFREVTSEHSLAQRQQAAAGLAASLGATLDYEQSLEALALSVVPALADECLVDMVGEDGELRRVVGDDAAWPPAGSAPAPEPSLSERDGRSALTAPVRLRGDVAGQITLVSTAPGRRFGERDVPVAEEVAARASTALENATLYREARRTSALLDSLYDSAPIGLGFWDRDLRYVRVNDALARINDRPAADHVGKTFAEVVPHLSHVIEPISRRVIERREPIVALEMASGTPSDPTAERHWLVSYYPVLAPDGEAIGVGGVIEEVTQRRRAERRSDLQHAVSRILTAESVSDAVPQVLRTLCEFLGFDLASYWPTDTEEPRLIWSRPESQADGFIAMTERSALSPEVLPGRVAQSGEAEWLEDLAAEGSPRSSVAEAEGIVSALAFPIAVEGETVAVMEAVSSVRRPRDDELLQTLFALGGQLGQFVRRKRVEEERLVLLQRERAARADAEAAAATLRKLERVAAVALEHHSLSDLLNALLGRIVEVLGADTATILLLDDDDRLRVRATVGVEPAAVERAVAIPLGEGMAGRVAANRMPLLVPDLSEIELVSPVLRERGINSLVAIPLVVEDEVIGVVHAGSEAYAQFVDEDAKLLELIADRIALAINQAALYEAERAAERRLQFLGEASTLLASSLDIDATLARVARLAVPQFADYCAVDLVTSDGTAVERVAFEHADPAKRELVGELALARPPRLEDNRGISGVIKSSEALLDQDIAESRLRAEFEYDPVYLDLLLSLELTSRMIVPLVVRGRTLGAITFVWAESGHTYGPADLQLAEELAARAAVAVDNAGLYLDAARARERLGFLAEASALLGSSLDVERTLDSLGVLVAGRVADWCAIHLVGEQGRVELATIASSDPERTAAAWEEHRRLPADREPPSAVRSVIDGGPPHLFTDPEELPEGSPERADGVHTGIVVPLLARDRPVGALTLVRSEMPDKYTEADLEFAVDLAGRAAVALDNARLYRIAEAARERVGLLAEASALLGSSLDVELTLVELSSLVVSSAADSCAIHLAGEYGPVLVSVAHVDPERARQPPVEDVGRVIVSGAPELRPAVVGKHHSTLVVPLVARGRTLGAMSWAWSESFASYDSADLEFALDLGRRAAMAIDNAELYREAEERAQAARVLASVGDGVFLVDRHGIVRTWNRAAAGATGVRAVEVVDRPAVDAIPGWAAVVASVPVSTSANAAPRAESLPLDLGGRELWLSLHGVAVPDGIVYAFRDLTEERALETMRTEFVSTVSHELRTPLAAIYGAAMTLRRGDVTLDDGQRARLLDVVSGEADRLARTVNDILWASRLDAGSLHVSIQRCDPLQLAHDVVEAQRAHLDAHHDLLLEADAQLPHVAGDPDKVGRVLINLVDNAVKYSPDGGRVDVRLRSTGGHVRFSITDRGLGIPLAEQRRVFEKFYRLDPNMTRGVGGTGLGLYICRELVRRMDGRIWVESSGLGGGATFHIELPVAADEFSTHLL